MSVPAWTIADLDVYPFYEKYSADIDRKINVFSLIQPLHIRMITYIDNYVWLCDVM